MNPYQYTVYRRVDDSSTPQIIASTRYLEDALAVLKNWHSGYVVDIVSGDKVASV